MKNKMTPPMKRIKARIPPNSPSIIAQSLTEVIPLLAELYPESAGASEQVLFMIVWFEALHKTQFVVP
jgi:hypothetical protein